MSIKKEIVVLALSALISAAIGTTATVIVQRHYISKYEESSLIRELIPLLISNDPRQVDMALLILQGTLASERYDVFKKIVDRKIEQITEKAIANPGSFPKTKKILDKVPHTGLDRADEMAAYAILRQEWSELVQKQLATKIKPMSQDKFLSLLDDAEKKTPDDTLKKIISTAKMKLREGNMFEAYVAADWVLQRTGDARAASLVGLAKGVSKEDAAKILKYGASKGYLGLEQDYEFSHTMQFNEPQRTPEELNRLTNEEFLKDLKNKELPLDRYLKSNQ